MSNLDNLPWHVETGRDYEDGQPNGFIVAAPATKAGSAGRAIAWVKEEAVAHIVAAAPDLLTSAKAVLQSAFAQTYPDLAFVELAEAIAKAEGRT